MRKLTAVCTVACLAMALVAPAEATVQDAADYLVNIQSSDGGWSWVNGGASASNITGATGIGLIRYYNVAGGSQYLDAAKAGGGFLQNHTYDNGETRFSTYDPYYCWQLSLAAGDNTWSNFAAADFFGELAAGTYGPADYDTAGWIGAVQTARTGTWNNLRPWEFSTIAVTARNIGSSSQADAFLGAILDGLDTLDSTAPASIYTDLIGVAGGVRGLALEGVTSFDPINSPHHAGIDGISTLVDLADYLAGQQNADGSWFDHSAATSESSKDTQVTAYAVLALEAVADVLATADYADELAAGRAWLLSMQDDTTGGFFYGPAYMYPPINNEVTGEALAATVVPEPASIIVWSLIALVSVTCVWRRRKRSAA